MRIQALELGKHKIRVNTVRPTVVLTPLVAAAWDKDKLAEMESVRPRPRTTPLARAWAEPGRMPPQQIPLGRLATPQDVGQCVAWLLSDLASMVTERVEPEKKAQ